MLYPAVIYTLMLLAPGYLVLRCMNLPRAYSVCCASVVTTAMMGLVGELYATAHLAATPLTVFVPTVALPLVALALLSMRRRSRKENDGAHGGISHADIAWWLPLLFAAAGLFVCNDLFVSELPSLGAVVQRYDVQHHLNVTKALAEAHRMSSLGINSYLSEADSAIMPFGRGSFYPAVWYGQCSLLMQITGLATPAALNVSLAVTMGVAYPLGMCALASSIFKEHRMAVVFCGLICMSFVTFPWCMLLFGPLYPNLVGFALLPATVTLCLHAFLSGSSWRTLAGAWVLAAASLFGQMLLHPNTVFSAYLILIPFVAQLVYTRSRDHGFGLVKAGAATAAFLLLCLAFWAFCFRLPALSGVVGELWPRYAYPWQEIVNILTQIYTLFFYGEFVAQVLLGALVVIGWVRQVYDRPIRWLAVSYLIICGICFINATTYNSMLKRFVAGFWYTDAVRVSAMAVIVAALIASYGCDWIYEQVCFVLDRHNERLSRKTHPRLAAAVLLACFYLLNFMPGFNWPGAHSESTENIVEYRIEGHEYDAMSAKTTFGDYKKLLRNAYNSHTPIDVHEDEFLQQVKEIVGSELVINDPCDGSTLAYGIHGIRVYYRKAIGAGGASETSQSIAIRQGLKNIESDASVRQAVEDIEARYVLVLDSVNSDGSFLNLRGDLDAEAYEGISSISPDTPGFTEVLVSGACHLYRINET